MSDRTLSSLNSLGSARLLSDTTIRWIQALSPVMRRLKSVLFLSFVYVRELSTDNTFELPSHLTVRTPSKQELLDACDPPGRKRGLGLQADWVEHALSRGDTCFAAFDGGQMVGYTWRTSTTGSHVQGIQIDTPAGYLYAYKGFVKKEYRGQRINQAILSHADKASIEQGYRQSVAFVETHNNASMATTRRKPNLVFVGLAGYLTICGRVLPFRDAATKRLGFRFIPPR